MLGPTVPKILGLFFCRILPLLMQHFLHFFTFLMQHFPHAYKHTHTMVPTESVNFYRNSDPKHFLFVKLFFAYSKISPPEFIYVRLFLHIRKLQPKTNIYVCNRFGWNGIS